jgi:ribosome biogenesis GTPase
MTKRKLNQQQQRRVAAKHAKLLDSPQVSGLVIAHHGKHLEVEDPSGQLVICNKRQNLGPIVPGDRVLWQLEPNAQSGVVTALEPRSSLLSRPDARGNLHAVAANIDQMFIVIAPMPAPAVTTVDRYLVAAIYQNIQPILVLNKEDLLPNAPQQQEIMQLLKQYAQINVTSLVISAKQQLLTALHAQLQNKTSVFVGQSGVGKSSIIANLLPNMDIKTGDLSTLGSHGKHTTTTARLYHLPDLQAKLIDSAGMRELPLWPMDAATLANCFVEFRPYLHECKYRNCSHVHEPGCALLAAVNAGNITLARLQSYQKIFADINQCAH